MSPDHTWVDVPSWVLTLPGTSPELAAVPLLHSETKHLVTSLAKVAGGSPEGHTAGTALPGQGWAHLFSLQGQGLGLSTGLQLSPCAPGSAALPASAGNMLRIPVGSSFQPPPLPLACRTERQHSGKTASVLCPFGES